MHDLDDGVTNLGILIPGAEATLALHLIQVHLGHFKTERAVGQEDAERVAFFRALKCRHLHVEAVVLRRGDLELSLIQTHGNEGPCDG